MTTKRVIVTVIGGLTENQAARISADILRAKGKYSRQGTATVAVTSKEKLGTLVSDSNAGSGRTSKRIGRKEQ